MKKLVLFLILVLLITGCSNDKTGNKEKEPEKNNPQTENKEPENKEPGNIENKEPAEVPEIYSCYEKEFKKEAAKSDACIKKYGEANCIEYITRYNKKVIRFKGESNGIKAFNKSLENVYNKYKLNNDLNGFVNYNCNEPSEKEILKGVNIDYTSEYLTLNQDYIMVRIVISHDNLFKNERGYVLDKLLVYDIKAGKEITIKELTDKLLQENNLKIESCDTSKGDTCIYNNILTAVVG